MSKAEELLNTLSTTTVSTLLADSSTEPHIVIGDDRFVTVPSELKRLAVQYDHDIETVTFDCPRYWDDHDMSEMRIYINYLRSDAEAGCYKAQNIAVDSSDENIMHFDWTISRNVTETFGKIVFLVCVKKTDDNGNEKNHWNSELCKDCYVSEGLEYDIEPVKELYPDLIENWYQEVLGVINEVNTVKQDLIDMRDSGEFDGATFTPSVSDDCDLSWTNNKGLPNPGTVNIKGDTGFAPTIDVTPISGGYQLTITDINGAKTVNIMDTIIDTTDAVTKMFNDFVYVGSTEPSSGPVLWFDTNKATS